MWKRWLPALAVALGALAVAGCGAEDVDPRTAVASAASATAEAGSARVVFSMEIAAEGETMTLNAEGELDFERNAGRLVYDLAEIMPFAQEEGEEGEEAIPEDWLEGEMTVLFDGLVYYTSMPELPGIAEVFGPGKRWMKIDLATEDGGLGATASMLNRMDANPIGYLDLLRSAGDEVEDLGTEEIRGVETTHYRAVLDFERAVEFGVGQSELTEEEKFIWRRAMEQLSEQSGLTKLPADAWIDADGRLRRIALDMDFTHEAETVAATLRMEFYDFGVEVDVSPPPDHEVIDLADTFPEELN